MSSFLDGALEMYHDQHSPQWTDRSEPAGFGLEVCRAAVGEFAWRKLEERGLFDLCLRIQSSKPLSPFDLQELEGLSLPLLGTMLRIRENRDAETGGPAALIRPLVCVPIAEMLESGEQSSNAAFRALEPFPGPAGLSLLPDRWHGRFSLSEICLVLRRVLDSSPQRVQVLGPTAKDIKDMLLASDMNPDEDEDVRNFLGRFLVPALTPLEVTTIHGGTSLRIHRLAAEHGFESFVAQDLNRYRIGDHARPEESCSSQLLAIRRELIDAGARVSGWVPLFRSVLDRAASTSAPAPETQPLGLEILKAVALARMALPEVQFIQAPLAIFGPKAADVALRFGANDLGFAAANEATAERLELPLLAEVEELFSTTPVRLAHGEENL